MSDVKRYRFSRCKFHFDPHVCLCGKVEHPDGDYVLYAEHACIVAEKDAEIQRLREALADAEHLCKWLLQSDITEADKCRAVRDLGITLALALNPPQQKAGE